MLHSAFRLITPLLAATVLLSACGGSGTQNSDAKLRVVVGFYPLQYIAEQLGGDHVEVENVTKPGAEPHDLELAPRDVGDIEQAGLVLYLKDFQPALDAAVAETNSDNALDVSSAAKLEEHAAEETEAHEGHDHTDSGLDPHFWLDPTRLAAVADEVATRMADLDPDNATTYQANATKLTGELTALDSDFTAGLATCQNKNLVTSHAAFGYLAERYGLVQESVNGIDPTQEPSAAQLAALTSFVREHKVSTIYTETLVSPAIADTLAAETGAKTAVLDPLEGLTADDPNADYQSVMKTNLATLKTGQSCP